MKSLAKLITVLLVMSSFFVLVGCGDNSGVPDGSTITVGPDFSQTGIASFAVPVEYTIVVRYANETPIPHANVNISGHYAATSAFSGIYQFYRFADPNSPTNEPVNSPFDIVTDDYGKYTFSVLLSAFTPTFTDTINVRSGTAFGSALLEIK